MLQARESAAVDGEREGLGARIRRLRLAAGLTQRELVEPSYTRGFLAAIESGNRAPGDDMLRQIADRLGVEPDDLRFGRPPGIAERLREGLAQARQRLSRGEVDEAAQDFLEVRRDASHYRLTDMELWAAYYLADVTLHRGDPARAAAEYDAVSEALPPGPQLVGTMQTLRAALVARRAYCLQMAGDVPRAVAVLEGELRTLRAAPTLVPDAEVRIGTALIYAFVGLDWRERARRVEAEMTSLLPRVTNREFVAQFCATAAQLPRVEAQLGHVERLVLRAEKLYRELGLTRELGICHWARGYVLRQVGRLAEAAAQLSEARDVMRAVGAVMDHAGATLELAEVRRRQGAVEEARTLAEEAAWVGAAAQHRELLAQADRLLGQVAEQSGDLATAERLLRRSADRYAAAGFMSEVVTTCRLLGELHLGQDRLAEAMAAFERGLRAAEKIR